jgi:7-cyano-7-deazaguanine synthase
MSTKEGVLLLSGGLDSATVLVMAQAEGWTLHGLSFDYGQKQSVELQHAKRLAAHYKLASHTIFNLDLAQFGSSALTDTAIEVPKNRSLQAIGAGIPSTYVPARNTVFLSLALALAESRDLRHLFLGINVLDYSGYPDCRPEFVTAFAALANAATRAADGGAAYQVHAPLIDKTKAQIVVQGLALGLDYGMTRSCYDVVEEGRSCGACDACILRLAAFAEVGEVDPAPYV